MTQITLNNNTETQGITVTQQDNAQSLAVEQVDSTQEIPVSPDVKFLRGFSPTVAVTEVEGGFEVTVTDAEHSETVFIANGESVTDEQIADAVAAYLSEHPVEETDPTVPAWAKQPEKPTYTAEEVGALPSDTEIPEVPTNVSAFQNDVGYLTSVPSEYVTESELAAKGYLTQHQDLSAYAKKTELPTVPTDVSAFTNDKGYLTAVPAEYVTETELSAKGYLTSVPSEYVTETELTSKGYQTASQVNALINSALGVIENGAY